MIKILRNYFIRLGINAATIGLVIWLLPGIRLGEVNFFNAVLVVLVFSILNAFLKQALSFFTCPLIFFTAGLIYVAVNALLLFGTMLFTGGALQIDNIVWALVGGLVIGLVGIFTERILDRRQVTVKTPEIRRASDILASQRAKLDREFDQNSAPDQDGPFNRS